MVTVKALIPNNGNEIDVELDNGKSYLLDIEQIYDLNLKIGVECSDDCLNNIIEASVFLKLYVHSRNFCLIRPRSQREVLDYLTRSIIKITSNRETAQNYQTEIIPKVVDRLRNKGYINDFNFCKVYINNILKLKPISQIKLNYTLKQKGIDQGIIDQVLTGFNIDDKSSILKMTDKKLKFYHNDNKKVINYLIHQGFSYDDIKMAVPSLFENKN